jgi:hypothetical protein
MAPQPNRTSHRFTHCSERVSARWAISLRPQLCLVAGSIPTRYTIVGSSPPVAHARRIHASSQHLRSVWCAGRHLTGTLAIAIRLRLVNWPSPSCFSRQLPLSGDCWTFGRWGRIPIPAVAVLSCRGSMIHVLHVDRLVLRLVPVAPPPHKVEAAKEDQHAQSCGDDSNGDRCGVGEA